MTKLRAIVGGLGVLASTALACAPKSGTSTHAPAASRAAAEPQEAAEPAATVAATSPTAAWAGVREQIERARQAGPLVPEPCGDWADELVALHLAHGEPFVGARLEAAALLRDCGRPERARERLDEAIEAMPRWARAQALDLLGVIAHEAGDDGTAIAHLNAALHADPALHEARSHLVRILLRIYENGGSHFARDDIQRHLDTWLELAPDDPRVHVEQARFETIRARREPAAAAAARKHARLRLLSVLGTAPDPRVRAEVFEVLGRLALDEGDEKNAVRACRLALELDPARGSAALMGAAVLLHVRDFEQARSMLEQAAPAIDPVDERSRLRLLAVALRGLGRFDDASAVYTKLLAAAEPDPIDVYNRVQLDLYAFERDEPPSSSQLAEVRERLDALVIRTSDDPHHAEIARRARADRRALDERASDNHGWPHRELSAEAVELERAERKHAETERVRLLELEAAARRAAERDAERSRRSR